MRKECLSMLFFLKRAQQKKSGEIPVYARITANGTRVDFSTQKSISENLWNQAKERAKGNSKKALDLNNYIDDVEIGMFKLMQEMQQDDSTATQKNIIFAKKLAQLDHG